MEEMAMSNIILPDSINNIINNTTGKVTETAGDLLDAALTYAGRNIINRYKYKKVDDEFKLTAYKQAQTHALKLQEIKNEKIQEYYGNYIENNIRMVAEKTLKLASQIPDEDRLNPNISMIGTVFEEAKYKTEPTLIDMFSNLLASSVDSSKVSYAHPSFAHIINEMSALDAENISLFASDITGELPVARIYFNLCSKNNEDEFYIDRDYGGFKCSINHAFIANENCNDERALSSSLSFLEKSGLISLSYESEFIKLKNIDEIDTHYEFKKYLNLYEHHTQKYDDFEAMLFIKRGIARLTNYGEAFLLSCIEKDKICDFVEWVERVTFSVSSTDNIE
jgi:hypothetical protein